MYAGSGAMRRRNVDEAAKTRAADGGAMREKKKRKRKIRLPKGFDPANPGPPPDPERWLPKWQRSDYKKKRNRRAPPGSKARSACRLPLSCTTIAACTYRLGRCA